MSPLGFTQALARPETWLVPILGLAAVLCLHYALFPRQWERLHRGEYLRSELRQLRTSAQQRQRERDDLARDEDDPLRRAVVYLAITAALVVPGVNVLGPIGVVFAFILAYFPGLSLAGFLLQRRGGDIDAQVVLLLHTLATRLEAQASIMDALRGAAEGADQPLRGELERLIRYGQSSRFNLAFERAYATTRSPFYRRMIRLLATSYDQRATSDQIAIRVRKLASMLRGHERFKRRLRAELASARRNQAVVMMLIPALAGIFLLLQFDTMSLFWKTDPGRIALLVLLLLWIGLREAITRIGKVSAE